MNICQTVLSGNLCKMAAVKKIRSITVYSPWISGAHKQEEPDVCTTYVLIKAATKKKDFDPGDRSHSSHGEERNANRGHGFPKKHVIKQHCKFIWGAGGGGNKIIFSLSLSLCPSSLCPPPVFIHPIYTVCFAVRVTNQTRTQKQTQMYANNTALKCTHMHVYTVSLPVCQLRAKRFVFIKYIFFKHQCLST